MLFTDSIFIIGLVSLFIVYFLVPKRVRWMLLLVGSIGFYAYSGPWNLIYIFVTALSTFLITNRISRMALRAKDEVSAHKSEWSRDEKKAFKEKAKKKRFRWLVLCLLLNFGMLAVIKYGAFTIHNINTVLGWFGSSSQIPMHKFLLPMGMSFYLFQTMGYAIDVYREKYDAEKNFARLSLFVSFFPQLIQGPISRYDDLSKGLFAGNGFESKRVMLGIQRILWGYFKTSTARSSRKISPNTGGAGTLPSAHGSKTICSIRSVSASQCSSSPSGAETSWAKTSVSIFRCMFPPSLSGL